MGRTLLVGHPRFTWREWVKEHAGPLVCLDPSFADHGPPCRAYLWNEGKVRQWRLVGTVDPLRNPVALFTAAWQLADVAPPDATFLLFDFRPTPVLRQLALSIAQSLRPSRVIVPLGTGLDQLGWPVGAEVTDLPEAFPQVVVEAQRRARWLEIMEKSEDHEVDLSTVTVEGTRLGSGNKMNLPEWNGWAEACGSVLHLVGDRELGDTEAGQYLDLSHTSRLNMATSTSYNGLVCSFASQEGEDFGIGFIRKFLPDRGLLRIKCTAVSPAPVRILRLGALRVDDTGREIEDVRAWTI